MQQRPQPPPCPPPPGLMVPEEGVGLDHREGIAPRGVQPGQEHQDKPVLSVEAWARWRRASEYEDLLAEERVLGDKRRAGPDGVDADRAHQRCPSADGPPHVRDGPATFVDASTDGRLDGPGSTGSARWSPLAQGAGLPGAGHTVQSAETDSPEAEALIVRVDGASSQHGRGSNGAVRSKAWICGFSSTQKTAACCGGLRYNPTMSRTLSMSNGSGDSVKLFVRCHGARPRRQGRTRHPAPNSHAHGHGWRQWPESPPESDQRRSKPQTWRPERPS